MKRSLFLGSTAAGLVAVGTPIIKPRLATAGTLSWTPPELRYHPPDATFFRTVCASYWAGLAYSLYQWPSNECSAYNYATCHPITQNLIATDLMNIFSGAKAGWTASMQLHMQELANVFNAKYPPASYVKSQFGYIPGPRPLDDAQTIADAAAVIGGFAGIMASLVIGSSLFPVILGASAGMLVVGLATYAYACANPGIKANDFDEAVASSAWTGAQIGAAGDLVTLSKVGKLPDGLSPYGFIAGGVLGATKYLFRKYYPYAWPHPPRGGHLAVQNPSSIGWHIGYPIYSHWGVTVTFIGTPCEKVGC